MFGATIDSLTDRIAAIGGALGALLFLMHRVFRYERDFIGDQRDEIAAQRAELAELRALPGQVAHLKGRVAEVEANHEQCERDRKRDAARIEALELQVQLLKES